MLPLLGQSRQGSNGNKGVLCIPPKLQHYGGLTIRLFSVIFRTHVGGEESHPFAEIQSVYSAAPADWTNSLMLIHMRMRAVTNKWIGNGQDLGGSRVIYTLPAMKVEPEEVYGRHGFEIKIRQGK